MRIEILAGLTLASLLTACQTATGEQGDSASGVKATTVAVAEAPDIRVGDVWIYEYRGRSGTRRWTERVQEVSGGRIVTAHLTGDQPTGEQSVYTAAGNRVSYPGTTFAPHDGKLAFPLAAGATWTHAFVVNGRRGSQARRRKAWVTDIGNQAVSALGEVTTVVTIRSANQLSTAYSPADETYKFAVGCGRLIAYSSPQFGDLELVRFTRSGKGPPRR